MKKIIKNIKKLPIPFMIYTRPFSFWKSVKFFEKSIKWTEIETKEWEFNKVKEIVNYAYKHVPFYHNLYQNYDLNNMKDWSDFEKLPTISKNDVKEHVDEIISDEFLKYSPYEMFTGGSTSVPMRFYVDKDMYYREWAFYYFFWKHNGFKLGKDKCIVLRGDKVAKYNNKGDVISVSEKDNYYRWLRLDSDYVSDGKYLLLYDSAIKKYKCDVIQAYPSSLYNLAIQYKKSNLKPPVFNTVFLGSENTYNDQIDFIKDIFSVKKITYNYGHSEEAIIGTKYDDLNEMGFYRTYGHLELIDSNGNNIYAADKLGEMVATSYNKSMPLIRYKTNDFATFSEVKSDSYMKNCVSIKRIEGRLQEFVVTSDNRLVSICTLGGAHISELQNVCDCQFEQFEPGFLYINIVEDKKQILSSNEKESICVAIEKNMENKIKCQIKNVSKIERTKRNKKSMIKQHINLEEYINQLN